MILPMLRLISEFTTPINNFHLTDLELEPIGPPMFGMYRNSTAFVFNAFALTVIICSPNAKIF